MHRRSVRLHHHDYSREGKYFVTLVTQDRELLFEDAVLKAVAGDAWRWLGTRYEHVTLDEYVIMPNHLHGILVFAPMEQGGRRTAPTASVLAPKRSVIVPRQKPLGQIIGAFKTVSTKRVNEIRGTPGAQVWQRNFYERILRSDDVNRVRRYIHDNPRIWREDPENPINAIASTHL